MLAVRTDLALGRFHPLPNFPFHLFPTFFRRLYKSGWWAHPYIKNNVRLSQGSDGLTAGSFKRIRPSLLLFLSLSFPSVSVPSGDHCSSHTYITAVGVMAKQMGAHFFFPGFTAFLWRQQPGHGKVKSSIKDFLARLIAFSQIRERNSVSHKAG